MATEYFYFVSSLPHLDFQGKLPFSTEQFLEDCRRLMLEKDAVLLRRFLNKETISVSHPVIAKIYRFENDLHNEIAAHRARKAGKEPGDYTHGEYTGNPDTQAIIRRAANALDPLEIERTISRARWHYYDNLMAGQFFNLAFVLLYGLKLQIVERNHTIASPKGKEVYEQLKKIEFPEAFASNV